MRHYRYSDILERHGLTAAYTAGLVKKGLFPEPIKTPGPRGCSLFDADLVELWFIFYEATVRGSQKSSQEAAEQTMSVLDEVRGAENPRQEVRHRLTQLRQRCPRGPWDLIVGGRHV